MPTDRQLRQRADELRQQLNATMRETSEAILNSMELSNEIAKRRHRQSLEDHFARTDEIIHRTRGRLDLRIS